MKVELVLSSIVVSLFFLFVFLQVVNAFVEFWLGHSMDLSNVFWKIRMYFNLSDLL